MPWQRPYECHNTFADACICSHPGSHRLRWHRSVLVGTHHLHNSSLDPSASSVPFPSPFFESPTPPSLAARVRLYNAQDLNPPLEHGGKA